ncbi:MAG: Asp-tRNA(Asn)/Glu-tRNA(Gln) amidotransferase subunit GatA [Bdellovibrionota bacterium]|nr:Asp-tRNA(Asn)/Glu-tRNA(Gln) amidotransferase subunit GatA [Bdellovibrionota bacterium]
MSISLINAKASEIVEAIKSKKISALEVTEFFLKRANELNPQLNAFISIDQSCIEQAKKIDMKVSKSEPLGKLAGLPIGVKDLLCVKDQVTTAASKMLANFKSPYSSTVVERLVAEDAVILGKTNLDEFAMGSSNETSYFGVVKNPWNVEFVPGGSSGGSASAVAARMCPVAIGTDTGGSIRQPANFCGIVGIKPSYGRVSRYGVVAFASSLDQVGPMATYVEDCALVLEVISGEDKMDSTSLGLEVAEYSKESLGDKKINIALPKQYFGDALSEDVKQNLQTVIEKLRADGHKFNEVDLPLTEYAISTYYLIACSEASSNLARYDGVRYGYRSDEVSNLESLYLKSRSESFGPEVKRRLMLGTYALSSGYYDAYFEKACKLRAKLKKEFEKVFESNDVILSPVTTDTAFKIGERISDPLQMYLNDILTISTNLAGLPAMSVPIGYSKLKMPIGAQVIARSFDEKQMIAFAKLLESKKSQNGEQPDVF